MRLFLDSNIFLRLLVPEDQKQTSECKELFNRIRAGAITPLTSDIVIAEVNYVLTKLYKIEKSKVVEWQKDLLKLTNLNLIQTTDVQKAINLYEKLNIKFGDCLIATQVPQGAPLCTYDSDFKKIKGLTSVLPTQIFNQ